MAGVSGGGMWSSSVIFRVWKITQSNKHELYYWGLSHEPIHTHFFCSPCLSLILMVVITAHSVCTGELHLYISEWEMYTVFWWHCTWPNKRAVVQWFFIAIPILFWWIIAMIDSRCLSWSLFSLVSTRNCIFCETCRQYVHCDWLSQNDYNQHLLYLKMF